MTIILYDLPSKDGTAWSPNTWKTRFSLNFKKLPYKTEWVEYPDIEEHCMKLGIPPTTTRPDGSPMYTLPAIHDPSTGSYMSDSQFIAEYLERTYPDTPRLFPHNTIGIQSTFGPAFMPTHAALWQFTFPTQAGHPGMTIRNAEYTRVNKVVRFGGKPLHEVLPKGVKAVEEWEKLKAGLDIVDSWYAKEEGPFIMGEHPCWADFVVGSFIVVYPKFIFGEDSQQWKDIMTWHDGRWKALHDDLEKYKTVV